MALGNAWHVPQSAEPRGRGAMLDPVGPIPAGAQATVVTGNQFQGDGGNPGNQLQEGSTLFFRRALDPGWTAEPLRFALTEGNNKYYTATVPGALGVGVTVEYYLRIAYDDHDPTFLFAAGDGSAATELEQTARDQPFRYTTADPATTGRWDPVLPMPNVGIHASVLPSGRVLLWGRRIAGNPDLDVPACAPFLWDPRTGQTTAAPLPDTMAGVNLFCSGHTFLPDGRLLVVGGHGARDGAGIDQSCVYDHTTNTWTPGPPMNHGRWYPTAQALPDGRVLVLSGSYEPPGQGAQNNTEPQVWADGAWQPFPQLPGALPFELYPRMHSTGNGRLVMSGPLMTTWSVGAGGGPWTAVGQRNLNQRDYCPAVTYGRGRLVYIGGGNDEADSTPTGAIELLDLSQPAPSWVDGQPMAFARQQHNGTLLADGTILVTGGTRGGGFNNLQPGQPVHQAEIWDPATGTWTTVAAEQVDRCYHSTAVLLPDGTVLSAGSGEFRAFVDGPANPPEDTHADAQVFRPPYLFRGPRPVITDAPDVVAYGSTFDLGTADPQDVAKVTWIRLSSVTHSLNMGQHAEIFTPDVVGGRLTMTAPDSASGCPPGHYLMFVISSTGVPSEAAVIRVPAEAPPPAPPAPTRPLLAIVEPAAEGVETPALAVAGAYPRPAQRPAGTKVVVGLTGLCPYGIGACWGGANEALRGLEGVAYVEPVPDAPNSTATLYLREPGLPPLPRWHREFRHVVNGRYRLRGIEMTLTGPVVRDDTQTWLIDRASSARVRLTPLEQHDNVRIDPASGLARPPEPAELTAYAALVADVTAGSGSGEVEVTGPVSMIGDAWEIGVRLRSRVESHPHGLLPQPPGRAPNR